MLAPTQRHKRPRSPSPPLSPDVASPLDVLLKRRRREELSFSSPGEHPISPFAPQHQSNDYFGTVSAADIELPHAESSTSALKRSIAGVERRRTKQWEKQNAPSISNSQPTPPHSNHYLNVTPTPRNAYSQPDPMSSSPIRNILPSSSPFKPKPKIEDDIWTSHTSGEMNDVQQQHQFGVNHGSGEEEVMDMNEDEMKREWGEAYEEQNWLLHSLHVARLQSQCHPHPSYNQISLHQAHTPLRQTESNMSNQTITSHDSTLISPYPTYRNQPSYPDSSPVNSHHPSVELRSPSYGQLNGMEDDDMEILHSGLSEAVEDEIRKRYEETNKLLAELEVVRRNRWG
ncbi:uncharacterized protein I206_100832 [Kwoniella pini CBS 10737]|uniref:Uncharacterized protein n=1 Tax=Kwoniella pini CBS 10737 TaxID=1296096 RepID=A0A1B9ICJ1_9TREE|nr:uncharacterized protein I206_00494 [Kwoniella pini CBS 10737]OCF53193.1 hypothetical protein I206_00494 [Kwoniella pini CBS 10737]